jgi:drug/metabolite transporter (DMT)-like permease
MSLLAIALISISAATHVGWNLISKQQTPSQSFFLAANALGALLLVPVLVWRRGAVGPILAAVWPMLILTGMCQAVYFTGLAWAYTKGDLSLTYPLIRSLPVVMVAAIGLLLGRGGQMSGLLFAGVVLVVGGSLIAPMRHFRAFHPRNYLSMPCLAAAFGALGTTGYSMIDDSALRALRASASIDLSAPLIPLVYLGMEGISTCMMLAMAVFLRPQERGGLVHVFRTQMRGALVAGAGIYFTYALVLVSMAYVADISYVVAFRQFSIPLGAVVGIGLLGEPAYWPRIAGVALMFAGLLFVALG